MTGSAGSVPCGTNDLAGKPEQGSLSFAVLRGYLRLV
jgi:hypothetical protein